MEEQESYNGEYRDGDRVYVDKPLPEVIEAENYSVTAIVLGALAVFFSELCFGFILGIFAIKNANKAKETLNPRHHKYHVATAAIVCGWISVGLSIFWTIFWIILWGAVGGGIIAALEAARSSSNAVIVLALL